MKLITNPLDVKIEIGVKGNHYEIEPKESLLVPDEVAVQWKTTHAFIIVTDRAPESFEKVVEPKAKVEPKPSAKEVAEAKAEAKEEGGRVVADEAGEPKKIKTFSK